VTVNKFGFVGEEGLYQDRFNFTCVATSQPLKVFVLMKKDFDRFKKMINLFLEVIIKLSKVLLYIISTYFELLSFSIIDF
jgi:hypothetical protein